MSVRRGLLVNAAMAAAAASLAWGCALIAGLEDRTATETTSTSSGTAGGGNGGTGAGGAGGSTSSGGGAGGGSCLPPTTQPEAIVTGQKTPTVIVADGSGVYWATEGTGPDDFGIWKLETPCGAAVKIAKLEQRKPIAIAADGAHVYWSESGEGVLPICMGTPNPPDSGRDRIMRVAKNSPVDELPVDFVYGMCGQATSIALGGDRVYWTRPSVNRVQAVHKETFGYLLVWYDPHSRPQSIVAGLSGTYWSDPEMQIIQHYDGNMPPEVLVQSAGAASHITMDDHAIYWTAGVELRKVELDAPGTIVPIYSSILAAAGIVTDAAATAVYIADTSAAAIVKVPKDGADHETIPTHQTAPGGVALDDTYVYWTQSATGEIWRAPR